MKMVQPVKRVNNEMLRKRRRGAAVGTLYFLGVRAPPSAALQAGLARAASGAVGVAQGFLLS